LGEIAIGLHGGCGTLARSLLSETEWTESRTHLADALRAGWRVLKRSGSALDAVQAAVVVLEDSPHFNAGHGAALNEAAEHELDASVMDGASLAAGAVCAVRRIRNPVIAARAVLDRGQAVLLAGAAADDFAERQGLAMVQPDYFTTQRRVEALRVIKARMASGTALQSSEAEKHGTVGAVARDIHGHLAAATSTGGFNNKPSGRVGDSPIIGAGTYANNATCAVSATGDGEYFIRAAVAHDVSALMEYRGMSLKEAAQAALDRVAKLGGTGGLIAIDHQGNVALPFNTAGMYRGYVDPNGKFVIEIYR
jgi:beta-aspartyl-peptidase (threonine type)